MSMAKPKPFRDLPRDFYNGGGTCREVQKCDLCAITIG